PAKANTKACGNRLMPCPPREHPCAWLRERLAVPLEQHAEAEDEGGAHEKQRSHCNPVCALRSDHLPLSRRGCTLGGVRLLQAEGFLTGALCFLAAQPFTGERRLFRAVDLLGQPKTDLVFAMALELG